MRKMEKRSPLIILAGEERADIEHSLSAKSILVIVNYTIS
jgi:hypothetical protein